MCIIKKKSLLFSIHFASKGNITVIKEYVIPTPEKQEYTKG